MTPEQQPSWCQFLSQSITSDELSPPNLDAKYQVFSADPYRTNVELQQYRTLYEHSPSIHLSLDAAGRIATVNEQGAACLGYTVSELVGSSIFSLVYPDDHDFLQKKLTEFLQNVTPIRIEVNLEATGSSCWELRQVCKDGRVIWVKAFAQPSPASLMNYNGNPVGASPAIPMRLVCEDITQWKQAELRLQQEKNFIAAVLDTIANLTVVLDPQGRIVRFNRACEQTTGYTFAEVQGVPFWDILLLPDEVAGVKATFSQLRAGFFPNEHENHWVTKTGSYRLIAWSNTAIVGNDGKVEYVIGTGLDITERRQTELALQRSQQQQYQHLVDSVEGIVWEGEAHSFQFSFVSHKAERILGYPVADWLGDSQFWLNHLHPDDRPWVMAACQRETQARQNYTLEYRMIAQDGRVIWFRDMITVVPDTHPLQLRGVMLDITERRHTETALAQSEAKWRSLIQNSSDITAILEADGTVRYQSPAVERVMGYSPEALVGRNALELIHPEDVAYVAQAFRDLVAGILPSLSIEFRFQHQDGSWRFMQSTGTNLLADPSVMGIVTNSRDITERKRDERALQKQTERERLMRLIAQRIHQSLDLTEILNTTVAEVRQFLKTDRTIIFRFNPDGGGVVSVESVTEGCQPILGRVIHDPCFAPIAGTTPRHTIRAIADLDAAEVHPCYVEMLAPLQVKASLVVPIFQGEQLWGLLIAHHCQAPRQWLPPEVNFLEELATQVAIAIQQSELYQQVQRLNSALESQVAERTGQLQQSLDFEAMLKRITDKVRDSLDESQILQTAVRELALGLQVACCDTALYDANYTTSTICYEYTTSLPASWGRVLKMADFPELYGQLLQGQYFQFCEIVPNPCRDQVAMLASPIFDDQGAIGDLWLFRSREAAFSELEIRLVQQVTNQCAIAIRQARLYQAAQAQVRELEKLNQLKDDFLSTVSHELRTPICNIKMAIQMLELSLQRENYLAQTSSKPARYLQVLQDECNREISLINDLLDLQRLDVGGQPLTLEILQLQEWIRGVAHPFYDRAKGRQQSLRLELPDHLPPILSHSSSLTRILAELLNNACKYTPPDEEIVVSVQVAAGVVQLKVTNFGVEIPAAELPHIFDKFYRVPSTDPWKQGGTGLGLALVQKLTEHLGGKIEVESAAGQTCFTVELPSNSTGIRPS